MPACSDRPAALLPAAPTPHTRSMPAIDLVVTDLDGTLWHTDDHVDPKVLAALAELERRGVPLLVATGRRVASTRAPLARIGQAPPAVVLNGALGVDLADGERFHRAPFPTAERIEGAGGLRLGRPRPRRLRRPPSLRRVPQLHAVDPRRARASAGRHRGHRRPGPSVRRGGGARLRHDRHPPSAAVRRPARRSATSSRSTSTDPSTTRATPRSPRHRRGSPSGTAWLAFCASRGLDSDRVLALADGPNDIELLTNASVRLVPAVAHPAALALADHLIPSAADGGWAEVLSYLD